MKTVKIFLVVAVMVGAAAYVCALEGANTAAAPKQNNTKDAAILPEVEETMPKLIGRLRNAKNDQEKETIFKTASNVRPRSSKDADDLILLLKATKSPLERSFALEKLGQTPDEPTLVTPFMRALDSDDRELRIVAIRSLHRMKATGALPRVRRILKDYSVMGFKTANLVSKTKARVILAEGAEAAMFLAEYRDTEGLNILVDKIEGLEAGGAKALGLYGKIALPKILELARDKKMKDYGIGALSAIVDRDAEDDLIYVAADRTESEPVRLTAVHALAKGLKSDKLIDQIDEAMRQKKDAAILDIASVACFARKSDKAVKILVSILANLTEVSYKDKLRKQTIISELGELKNPLAVTVLEKQLVDSDTDTRQLTARALKEITGKEYDWQSPR